MSTRTRPISDRDSCDWKMCYILAKRSLQSEVWGKWKYGSPGKASSSKAIQMWKAGSSLAQWQLLPMQATGREERERNTQGWNTNKKARKESQVASEGLEKTLWKQDQKCFFSIQIFSSYFSLIADSPQYVSQPLSTMTWSKLADKKQKNNAF